MLEGLALGADDYIPKSAEFVVLKARLRVQLRRSQFEDESRRVREQLLRSEFEATEARAARELAHTRALLVDELEQKNAALKNAYEELKSAQAQLIQSAKMASLGGLVAGVAHEINNPLSFVISHLETIDRCLDRLPGEAGAQVTETHLKQRQRARDRLRETTLGVERMRDLVIKLRTFSRLDEGERKVVSFKECISSLLTMLGHRLGERIAVQVQLEGPDLIDCYPSLLNQALMNLVSNAIDAIENEGSIGIRSELIDSRFAIVISDTGTGIPEALRERVLEPFFTTKPVGQGTGLGLSITYAIVRRHGGTLELASSPTGGTQATIHIPVSH
jgi:two-component system, NtrC family, sensor kinase